MQDYTLYTSFHSTSIQSSQRGPHFIIPQNQASHHFTLTTCICWNRITHMKHWRTRGQRRYCQSSVIRGTIKHDPMLICLGETISPITVAEEKCFTLTPVPAHCLPQREMVSLLQQRISQREQGKCWYSVHFLSAASPKSHLTKLMLIMCFPGWDTGARCPAESLWLTRQSAIQVARRSRQKARAGHSSVRLPGQWVHPARPDRRSHRARARSAAPTPARPRSRLQATAAPGSLPWRRSAALRGLSPSTNGSANA